MKRAVLIGLVAFFVPGCAFFTDIIKEIPKNQTKEEIAVLAALLPEKEAKELVTYHANHTALVDARLHTGKTCPFLVYAPAFKRYEAGQMSDQEWAEFLHNFYEDKHDEEKDLDDCDCDDELEE